jgi:Na+-transporting NADH:ubiquinone oxidoreductase subunit NqrB
MQSRQIVSRIAAAIANTTLLLKLEARSPSKRVLMSGKSQMWEHPLGDARYFQIAALGCLLALNIMLIEFGARPLSSAVAIGSALLAQWACVWLTGLSKFDFRSPLITGLSLSLLLRADAIWLYAAAAAIAIFSKFLFRVNGKHIWNPAGFAIVVLLLVSNGVWISPGQWGAEIWFAVLTGCLAILVLSAARRADIAIFFFASHAGLLLARAWWLGDPLAIPIHQLQSGSLLIFTFFMISDPRTAPDSMLGRFLFAFAVALLAHYMAFFMQMRPALYFALVILAPIIPITDRLIAAPRHTWIASDPQGAPQ